MDVDGDATGKLSDRDSKLLLLLRWIAFAHTVAQWLFTVLDCVEGYVSSGNTRAVFLVMMFA